ncbi:MAG: addiction module toxin RelE [Gammaproteobacteria bacterium 28-57-27]|nr:MAG: addiction module toxin RelE [Gammaproteobacteria bacterium 28-57-27]
MKLVWTQEALEDRRIVYSYIEAENPRAAISIDELFAEKANLLRQHPHLGRTGRIENTREFVVHNNYLLVYNIKNDVVCTLRLMHAARQFHA